jgi:ABC-type amino acid transport substrate-binding protein
MEVNNQIENTGNKKKWMIWLVVIVVIVGAFVFLNMGGETEEITGKVIVEEEIIINAGKLRIVTSEELPMNYYSKDGEFTGTTVEIVNEIKRNLNLDTEIEVMAWARAYETAKENPNIVIFTAGKTDERVDLGFSFIGPVISRKHSLWAKKGSGFNLTSIEDIREQNLVIGAMRGDWREKYFLDLGFDVDDVTDHRQNLEKLLDGRIDLWVSSDLEASPITKELGVDMDEIEMVYVFIEAPSYLMLSKGTSEETIKDWKESFEEMQRTGFFERASEKWSGILGSEVGYTKDTGFFVGI